MTTILPDFDFSPAESMTVAERFSSALEKARSLVEENGCQRLSGFPCVPTQGATAEEISRLEAGLEHPLPVEYREFLEMARYLKIDDGYEIGGMDADGRYVTALLWVSDQHASDTRHLVFADYWAHADGDQMLIDLANPDGPVYVYLHEYEGLIEQYAPSFSLAVWRLVHEYEELNS